MKERSEMAQSRVWRKGAKGVEIGRAVRATFGESSKEYKNMGVPKASKGMWRLMKSGNNFPEKSSDAVIHVFVTIYQPMPRDDC